MKGVVYKGVRLMPGSEALKLYEEKKWEQLDKHMAELDRVWRKMEGR